MRLPHWHCRRGAHQRTWRKQRVSTWEFWRHALQQSSAVTTLGDPLCLLLTSSTTICPCDKRVNRSIYHCSLRVDVFMNTWHVRSVALPQRVAEYALQT